jgi:virginiamycin A acetyltransferase
MQLHPVPGQERVVYLKPLVTDPRIEVGDYTYYDDPDDPLAFEREAFLYGYGPERLVIGRYCAIASKVRFLMSGGNHADLGPSTFPFGIFGAPWAERTMDLVMSAPGRGDTVVGHDVWLGHGALVMPGVSIGSGAVVAAEAWWPRTCRRTRSSPATRLTSFAGATRTTTSSACCALPGGIGPWSS